MQAGPPQTMMTMVMMTMSMTTMTTMTSHLHVSSPSSSTSSLFEPDQCDYCTELIVPVAVVRAAREPNAERDHESTDRRGIMTAIAMAVVVALIAVLIGQLSVVGSIDVALRPNDAAPDRVPEFQQEKNKKRKNQVQSGIKLKENNQCKVKSNEHR